MEKYRTIIESELSSPQFEMTKVYLDEGLTPQRETGEVVISSVDESTGVVLVALEEKDFFLEFRFDEDLQIVSTDTSPFINLSLSFSKSNIPETVLKQINKTNPIISDTEIDYTLESNQSFFSSRLEEFLLYLEQDSVVINELVKLSGDSAIWAMVSFHGSYPFSGLDITRECVRLLETMGLNLVFDIYST